MDEKLAIETLKQVKEIFDNHCVAYWLDFGTLLGVVRDQKFIPWDHDIDLSTWKKNKEKLPLVLRDLSHKGFKIYGGESVITFRKDNFPVSLNMYNLAGEKAIWEMKLAKNFVGKIVCYLRWVISAWDYSSVCEEASNVSKILHKILFIIRNTSLKEIVFRVIVKLHWMTTYGVIFEVPSHYFKNLSTIKFYGMEFKVPAETEKYLAYRYGKDWRIPKRDYIYYKEDKAIKRDKNDNTE